MNHSKLILNPFAKRGKNESTGLRWIVQVSSLVNFQQRKILLSQSLFYHSSVINSKFQLFLHDYDEACVKLILPHDLSHKQLQIVDLNNPKTYSCKCTCKT